MKRFLREFGEKSEANRQKMVAAAKRALKKGDDSVYHNAVSSLLKGGANKETLGKFQSDFEKDDLNDQPANNLATTEGKQYKVSEEQLHQIIKESVNMILKEYGNSQIGQYQLGRLAARKKANDDEEGYKNVVNKAKLQWGADRGVGTNQNAFGNGMHVGKDNVKQGYDLAKKGKL
jgi:hypothetical protein